MAVALGRPCFLSLGGVDRVAAGRTLRTRHRGRRAGSIGCSVGLVRLVGLIDPPRPPCRPAMSGLQRGGAGTGSRARAPGNASMIVSRSPQARTGSPGQGHRPPCAPRVPPVGGSPSRLLCSRGVGGAAACPPSVAVGRGCFGVGAAPRVAQRTDGVRTPLRHPPTRRPGVAPTIRDRGLARAARGASKSFTPFWRASREIL